MTNATISRQIATRSGRTVFAAQPMARAVAFALLVGANPLWAGPTGEQVVAGQATVSRAGASTVINQTTGSVAINWLSFNIGATESVRFDQPSASSIALNRVLGQSPTEILGSLSANGQVFILNPNGVLFGKGAQIDVGGLVASTLSLGNEDFMAGRYRFVNEGATGVVSNAADIIANGGYVAFIGPQVKNEGTITAANGSVALAAGNEVTLNLTGNKLIGLTVDKGALNALADNKGLINAGGGQVILTAKAADALIKSVVNNDGIIEAGTLSNVNGVIRLEADNVNLGANSVLAANGTRGGDITVQAANGTLLADGRIEAKGSEGNGGNIKFLGHQVGLINNASVDASGNTGGGTVLVGGDFQGKNPEVQNAFRTFVGADTTIKADAISSGDGGKVIVWADDVTRYYGSISARGGSQSGNGGFVEVSGKGFLDFNGTVDTSAPHGNAGTLLLDPTDITISTGVNSIESSGTTSFQEMTPTNTSVLNTTTLQTALGLNNVVVTTASAAAGTGNITVSNAVTWASTSTLTLTAGSNIAINAAITTGAAGSALILNATGAVSQGAAGIIGGSGGLIQNGAGTVALNQANTYTGATTINAGTVTVTDNTGLGTAAGGTTVNAGASLLLGNVTVTGEALALNSATFSRSANSPTWTGGITLTGNNTVDVGGGGGTTMTLSGVIGGTGGITKTGARTLVLSGSNTYGGATNINAGTLQVAGGSGIGDTSAVSLGGGVLDLNGTNEAVGSVTGTTNITLGAGTLTTGGDNTSTSYSGVISGTGGLTKLGTGTQTLSGTNTYTGVTTINGGALSVGTIGNGGVAGNLGQATSAAANLILGGGTLQYTGATASTNRAFTLTVATTSSIDVTTNNLTISGVSGGTGSLTKIGAGTLTLSGANTFTGVTTINAGVLSVATIGNGGAAGNLGQATNTAANLVLGGGTLQYTGATTSTDRAFTLTNVTTSSIEVTTGANTLTILGASANTTGSLTKIGTGTLALSGSNAYTGTTRINAGTLSLGSSNVLADGSSVVVNGGTLSVGANSDTVAGVQLLSGSISGGHRRTDVIQRL